MKKSISVLIADDEPAIGKLIKTVVEMEGYSAVNVANGREAIRQLEQNHFDIVLCDETMPYVRGSEVAEWMRNREATRYIPFVLISAEQNSQFFGELMTAGKINSYLAKPFSVQAIINIMSIYLKSSAVV